DSDLQPGRRGAGVALRLRNDGVGIIQRGDRHVDLIGAVLDAADRAAASGAKAPLHLLRRAIKGRRAARTIERQRYQRKLDPGDDRCSCRRLTHATAAERGKAGLPGRPVTDMPAQTTAGVFAHGELLLTLAADGDGRPLARQEPSRSLLTT